MKRLLKLFSYLFFMKIYGKYVDDELILRKINRPVKYGFVLKIAEKYLMNNSKELDLISKGKVSKKFIKNVRCVLHSVTGAYSKKGKIGKRERLLAKEDYDGILKSSVSTRERSYGLLYEEIFSITSRPKKIIDYGAGINPVSLHKYPGIFVFALEINKNDVDFLNKYFIKLKNGKAELFDLNKTEKLSKFKGDVGLLFKVVDVLDLSKGHKNAEKIICAMNVKWLVVSFATKTLSGKDMNFPYRGWFERLCERLKWKYKKLIKPNEIFYVVEVR